MIDDILYRRSFTHPYLRCLIPSQAEYEMNEVHEGICGAHHSARTLSYKLMRLGYYSPTMQKDCIQFVKFYDSCQRYANLSHRPSTLMSPMQGPWPFSQWGLDLIGSLPKGRSQMQYAIVTIDYFTKWVEAKALVAITITNVVSFLWKNIICRFGLPRVIITDLGRQFDSS